MADYVPVTGGRALAQSQDLLANRPRQNAKSCIRFNGFCGGCVGSLQRTALRPSNSLITGKIEGISSILGPSRVTRPLHNNRLAANSLRPEQGIFYGKQGVPLRQEGIL